MFPSIHSLQCLRNLINRIVSWSSSESRQNSPCSISFTIKFFVEPIKSTFLKGYVISLEGRRPQRLLVCRDRSFARLRGLSPSIFLYNRSVKKRLKKCHAVHVPSAGNAFHRFAQAKRALHLPEAAIWVQEHFTPQLRSNCESVLIRVAEESVRVARMFLRSLQKESLLGSSNFFMVNIVFLTG